MGTFINPTDRIEVRIDGENSVFLRAKMDIATQASVERDFLQMRVVGGNVGDVSVLFSVKGQQLALLKHNLVRWNGPLFCDDEGKPVPCRAEMVERLDVDSCAWWMEIVVNKIVELNPSLLGGGSTAQKKTI